MDVFTYTTTSKYSDLGPDGFLSNIGFLRIMQEAASLHSESMDMVQQILKQIIVLGLF